MRQRTRQGRTLLGAGMSRRNLLQGFALGAGAALLTPVARHGAARQATPRTHPETLTDVVIATGFFPNVQFAPYYLATDRGYYAEEGVNVSFQDGPGGDLLAQVAAGTLDFLISGGDAVALAAAAGVPVTYIMAQFQRYPVGAIALADSGVTLSRPSDLKGLRIGVSAPNGSTYIGLLALLQAANLTLDDVEVIAIGFTEIEALQQGEVDAAMTFITNEPVQVKVLGIDVTVLPVSDYVNLVSTGLVTASDRIAKDPELVQAVVTATLRGLRDTLNDPDAAFTATLSRLPEVKGDPAQEKIQREVLDATLAFEQKPEGHPLGWSDPAAWETTVQLLEQVGLINQPVEVTSLFTNQFAEAAHLR